MVTRVLGVPVTAFVRESVVWKTTGTPAVGRIPQKFAGPGPLLMMVAKAVAGVPTWTERLEGSTAAKRETPVGTVGTVIRPILPTNSVNHRAPSGPAVIPPTLLAGAGMANSVMAP